MFRKILKVGAALGVVALSAWGALALSVDQNRNMVARVEQTQQTNYYRFTMNFNDAGIGTTGQRFGRLLQNTSITKIACQTTTAFNGSTNTLQIGTSAVGAASTTVNYGVVNATQAGTNMLIGTAGYQEASPTNSTSLGTAVTSANDVDLWAKYVSAGSPSAGSVTCVIEYVPNNDM